ncbi:fungal-specific transcription factor domain-containing protein [Lipomyces kononenkoae]|uniref:Fungal-specific transcription factor domain-containing protein n=1 Tax=Lipomyces kononenkoae TaxID=34357 RepID=A0ACC3SYJ4_LIPKO
MSSITAGSHCPQSIASSKPVKSRKGLPKVYSCDAPQCRKRFTRQEHLRRHKLNHSPKEIYFCNEPGCDKSFVRKDLMARHLERHKGRSGLATDQPEAGSFQVMHPMLSTAQSPGFESAGFPAHGMVSDTSMPSSATSYQLPHDSSQLPGDSSSSFALDPTDGAGSAIQSSNQFIDWLFSTDLLARTCMPFGVDENSFLWPVTEDFSTMSSPASFAEMASISEEKRHEILQVIASLSRYEEFSASNIKLYIDLYWEYFHFQFPILHRPSFEIDSTPVPLILCLVLIGAYYGNASQDFLLEIATPLRWILFSSPEFHPPAKVEALQSLLLLEAYEKTMSCKRVLHERAYIHHGAIIQLIRRGSTLLDPSLVLPNEELDRSTWRRWIEAESIKLAVFMAFILDISHSVIFGHGQLMHPHEIRLSLPCDDQIWNSSKLSGTQVHKSTCLPFLEALKRLLNGEKVETNELGILALLYGLVSLSTHIAQQDLQVNFVGWGSVRDQWKPAFGRAYDFCFKTFAELKTEKHNKTSFALNYHFAHIAMYIPRYDLHVFCGDKLVLGLVTLKKDYLEAEKRMNEWARTQDAQRAAFHAIKALYGVFIESREDDGDRNGSNSIGGDVSKMSYAFSEEKGIHSSMIISHCMLVFWAYAFCLNGPESRILASGASQLKDGSYGFKDYEWALAAESGRSFLLRTRSIKDLEDLAAFPNKNHTVGLLKWIILSLSSGRTFFIDEICQKLDICVKRSLGWAMARDRDFDPRSIRVG